MLLRPPHGAGSVCAALLAGATALGCIAEAGDAESVEAVAERSDGIAGGYGDIGDAAVLGLTVIDGDANPIRTCTATLIAPNLVLTAQHCLAQTTKYVECDSAMFGPAADASRVYVTTSTSMWSASARWRQVRAIVTPPGVPKVCGRDLALLVLDEVVPADEATPITPRLDLPVAPTEMYSAIGYGNTAQDYDDGGLRRRRDGLIVRCAGGGCASSGHVDGSEWRGDHGICNGDSGGPAIDQHGRVMGVTSRGPIGCDDPIYGGLFAWGPWMREVAAIAAADGEYPTPAWIDGPVGESVSLNSYDAGASCSQAPGRLTGRAWGAAAALALVLLSALLRRRSVTRA